MHLGLVFSFTFSLMFRAFPFRAGGHCHPVAAAHPLSRPDRADSQEQKQNLFHAAGSAAFSGSFKDFDPLA
ncbi:MAG: hypothetical protein KA768_05160 [Desulfobulbus sp.]|nr:hypothetical protein [Desulfobulbus sp.]